MTVSSNTIRLGAERTYTTAEIQGVSRSDRPGGMFDNMTARCLGTTEVIAGALTGRGSCVETYQDGSQTFTTDEARAAAGGVPTGTHSFVGGTGKYAGISGTASFTVQSLKTPENIRMTAVRHRATYTLP